MLFLNSISKFEILNHAIAEVFSFVSTCTCMASTFVYVKWEKWSKVFTVFPWFLPAGTIISDRAYLWVQYKGRNKTRAGSNNFSPCSFSVRSNHTCTIEMYMTDVFVPLGMYSAVQCVSTDQLDMWSESSKSSLLPAMSVAVYRVGTIRGRS